MQRAAIMAGPDLRLGRMGRPQSAFGGDGDEAVQHAVVAGDAIETGLGEGDRRQCAGPDGGREFRDAGGGRIREVGMERLIHRRALRCPVVGGCSTNKQEWCQLAGSQRSVGIGAA